MPLLSLIVPLFLGSPAFAKKTMIFINFGDGVTQNDAYWASLGEIARRTYGKLGYDDIRVISPTLDIKARLASEIGSLQGVSELAIETIGHGNQERPESNSKVYPTQRLRPNSSYGGQEQAMILFANGARPSASKNPEEVLRQTGVGLGDLQSMVREFKRTNPGAKVSLNMQQCFGGMMAKGLIADADTYAATSDREMSHYKGDERSGSFFMTSFFDELERSADETPRPDRTEVFRRARRRWMATRPQIGNEYMTDLPWTPVDAYLNSWCDEHPSVGPTNSAPLDGELERLKMMTDETSLLEEQRREQKDEILLCKSKLARAKEMFQSVRPLQKAAVATLERRIGALRFEQFVKLRKNLTETSPPATQIRTRDQFLTYKKSLTARLDEDCEGVDAPTCHERSETAKSSAALVNDGKRVALPPACLRWGIMEQGPCVEWLRANASSHPGETLVIVKRLESMNIQMLAGCTEEGRFHYLRDCYDHFWKGASNEDRSAFKRRFTTGRDSAPSDQAGAQR